VAQFKYLGTTVTDQKMIVEEIKRSNSGSARYHSIQNFMSSCLLSENIKIKNIQNNNFACGSVWVWNLVSDIKGGT
jgi:hypothetical protein